MNLDDLTVEQVKEAFVNSGFDAPLLTGVRWTGEHSRKAWVYEIYTDPSCAQLAGFCAWVYIREKDGKIYADL